MMDSQNGSDSSKEIPFLKTGLVVGFHVKVLSSTRIGFEGQNLSVSQRVKPLVRKSASQDNETAHQAPESILDCYTRAWLSQSTRNARELVVTRTPVTRLI